MTTRTRLLGVDFANFDAARAARWIAERPERSPFEYVVTPNADHLVRLARHPELRRLYETAWLHLLDSRVVAGAARALRLEAPTVAAGSDLTALLLRNHLRPGERITIVGLAPRHLPALIARCGLAPPAHIDPPMGFERNPSAMRRAVNFVLANPTRFVFLAVGSPRQEMLSS